MSIREQFERWYRSNNPDSVPIENGRMGNTYHNPSMAKAWVTWQAAYDSGCNHKLNVMEKA